MTRGTLVLLLEKEYYTSIKFNGDMYLSGMGIVAIEHLLNSNTPEEFNKELKLLNKGRYEYCETLMHGPFTSFEAFNIDSIDYFKEWFSDYLYIKNASKEYKTITTESGLKIELKPNDILILNFGELYSIYSSEFQLVNQKEEQIKEDNKSSLTAYEVWYETSNGTYYKELIAKSKEDIINKLFLIHEEDIDIKNFCEISISKIEVKNLNVQDLVDIIKETIKNEQ